MIGPQGSKVIRMNNIYLTRIQEGKKRENGVEKIFEKKSFNFQISWKLIYTWKKISKPQAG